MVDEGHEATEKTEATTEAEAGQTIGLSSTPVDEPQGPEPGTDEPGTDEPGTDEPGTAGPEAHDPETHEPRTEEPQTHEPESHELRTEEPETEMPRSDEPGTHDPGTDQPAPQEDTGETAAEDAAPESDAPDDPESERPQSSGSAEPSPESATPTAPADAAPPRRSRRATRGVTTVAFSSHAEPTTAVEVPRPAAPVASALFQPPAAEDLAPRRARRATRPASAAATPSAPSSPLERSGEDGDQAQETAPGADDTTTESEPARRRGRRGQGGPTRRVEPASTEQSEPAPSETEQSETAPFQTEQSETEQPETQESEPTPTELRQAKTERSESELSSESDEDEGDESSPRRRRRRGGRRRRRQGGPGQDGEDRAEEAPPGPDEDSTHSGSDPADQESIGDQAEPDGGESAEEGAGARRRRRRRRRAGVAEEMEDLSTDDPPNTVVKIRTSRQVNDEITSVRGSTRIEAKRQRRRDGRDAGRRRAPILTEAEFLARRESVERVMCVRELGDRTQIAVLEDGILVEHYVNRASSGSMVGNVHLGRVQNVLPSMEAAFVDIGRSRNAVLYAGEVNWDAAGLEGQAKRIELAMKSGDPVLVQVTKDPIGHKGARLTSQISLPGRYLVYVPEGSMTGISRKLPDTERSRLKGILKDVLPEGAGVIVRTAAEGATEEQLRADVDRLRVQWADILKKAKSASAPALLYGEPDLAIKVVRDIFNEDFHKLVVAGDGIWSTLHDYIGWVAPDLLERLTQWTESADLFGTHRIDEQLAKALDRKVWLPSGGSLVIDRTEAMTVVDVNTGKFTGQGGNLEETVTRNNLEAAEEIVRQLRLRDIGGIIVVDFIDMVLENNRDLVLRRLVECLGRDRTRHQVAEVTSLGLVQMTRKRIGQGLLEVFSTPCEHCGGRGHVVHTDPVAVQLDEAGQDRRGDGRSDRAESRGRGESRSRRGAGAQPPAVAPLGGKQTGHTPPPPRLDEQGHVSHDELTIDEGLDTQPSPEPLDDDDATAQLEAEPSLSATEAV